MRNRLTNKNRYAVLCGLAMGTAMNAIMGMEFSLPDLGAYHISPDRALQTFAFLFAVVAAGLLLWLGLRLRRHS